MSQARAGLRIVIVGLLIMLAGCQGVLTTHPSPAPGGDKSMRLGDNALFEHLLAMAKGRWPSLNSEDPRTRPLGALPGGEELVGPGEASERWRDAYYARHLRSTVVGIYTGPGAEPLFWRAIAAFCDHHGIAWERFDETELDTLSQRFEAIWFGGGFSSQYRTKIGEHQKVRDFVNQGGAFLGICAGAYYPADTMRWHGAETEYPLKLFDGDAIGPLQEVPWGEVATVELATGHLVNRRAGDELNLYYMGGPHFTWEDGKGFETIATYQVNSQPAVLSFLYGDGRVMLIGPHPEMGYNRQAGEFTIDGSQGAQWPWLRELLLYALYY